MSKPPLHDRPENLVIRASAGTGKTFQLSNRFLALLDRGVAAERILATTFTRKAAGEILDRVLVRLAEAARDPAACAALGRFIGDASLSRDRCLALLETLLKNLHRLRVSTLDAFFAQIARSFSLELGLPPGWQIVDETEDAALRSEAVEESLRRESTQDLLALVHLLTKGETTRGISRLVRSTVDNLYDLFREADAAAWHGIPRRKPMDQAELEGVIEELRAAELPGKRLTAARDKDCDRAAEGDWETFVTKGLASKVLAGDEEYGRQPIPAGVTRLYAKLIDHARAVLVGRVALQTEGTYKLLERFDAIYRRLKYERRAVRFEDVTRRLAGSETLDGNDRLAFRLDAGVDHLLLDEFQDTSLAQWQVLRPFARRAASSGSRTSFFCVGDVKQAIYGWRGGIAEIFDALPGELDGLTHESLNQSFRSAQPVIDTVNRIFSGIAKHPNLDRYGPPVRRWCESFREHTTAKSELAGYASLATAAEAAEGRPQGDATLRWAANQVARIVQQAPGFRVGVLVRRNAAVAELIYLLRTLGVPASEEGGNPLTDSAAVQVVLSLLHLADHPGDKVARFHVAHSPLGPVVGLGNYGDDRQAEQVARRVRRALVDEGYGPAVWCWAKVLAPACNRRQWSRLVQLVESAYGYQDRATLRADDFVEWTKQQRVADPTSAAVRVMTVHQAKGLQFDVVVLPELDVQLVGQAEAFVVNRPTPTAPVDRVCRYVNSDIQQLLPEPIRRMFSAATHRQVAEALCVLYVAVTRAVHALHIIVAPSRPNERNLPKTMAGLLRAALTDASRAAAESVLYEHGDPDWFRHAAGRKAAAEPMAEPAAATRKADQIEPVAVRLAPAGGRLARGLRRTTPSGLEGGRRVKLAELLAPRSGDDAMQRGTLVHAWFEQIAWLEDGRPDDAVLRRIAGRQGQPSPHVDAWIEQFHRMLDRPAVAAVLSRSSYGPPVKLKLDAAVLDELASGPNRLEVQTERSFAVRDADAVLHGSIDRLVLISHGDRLVAADVIDFKTDAVSADRPETLDAKVAYYRSQLDAYRRAVTKTLSLGPERISARLLFVGPGIVCDV